MASKLYEPIAREAHASFAVDGEVYVYVWGGATRGSSENDRLAPSRIEQFDPYLEVWDQLSTVGTPHPGFSDAVCTSFGEHVYMYGGYNVGKGIQDGILSCLDTKTLAWSMLSPARTAGGPMSKTGCGIVHFHHDKLAVIGGYGVPTGPTQPGSLFIRNIMFTDGRGWTNEIHIFDIRQGI